MNNWLATFLKRFKSEVGRNPNPLEVAHNLPRNMSDSDAMSAMVQFMENDLPDEKE